MFLELTLTRNSPSERVNSLSTDSIWDCCWYIFIHTSSRIRIYVLDHFQSSLKSRIALEEYRISLNKPNKHKTRFFIFILVNHISSYISFTQFAPPLKFYCSFYFFKEKYICILNRGITAQNSFNFLDQNSCVTASCQNSKWIFSYLLITVIMRKTYDIAGWSVLELYNSLL